MRKPGEVLPAIHLGKIALPLRTRLLLVLRTLGGIWNRGQQAALMKALSTHVFSSVGCGVRGAASSALLLKQPHRGCEWRDVAVLMQFHSRSRCQASPDGDKEMRMFTDFPVQHYH